MQAVKYLMPEVAFGLAVVPLALKTSLNKINQIYWNNNCSGSVLAFHTFK